MFFTKQLKPDGIQFYLGVDQYKYGRVTQSFVETFKPIPTWIVEEARRLNNNKNIFYFCDFTTYSEVDRKKGYGREMLKKVKDYFKGSILYLYVGTDDENYITNQQLTEFYSSEGFNEIFPPEGVKSYKNYRTMIIEL